MTTRALEPVDDGLSSLSSVDGGHLGHDTMYHADTDVDVVMPQLRPGTLVMLSIGRILVSDFDAVCRAGVPWARGTDGRYPNVVAVYVKLSDEMYAPGRYISVVYTCGHFVRVP